MNTIESALKVTLGEKSRISIVGAFQSDTLPTALSQPFVHEIYIRNEASHYVFVNLSQKVCLIYSRLIYSPVNKQ